MKTSYQVVTPKDSRQLSEFLAKEGQLLLPMLDLITQAEMAVDELIDVAGRATIEAVLKLSAQEVAGPKHPGRKVPTDVGYHGQQKGVVCLSERKLRVQKPRLRRRGGGQGAEVELPAYAAMQNNSRLGRRMLEILMHGVSTRSYQQVLPEMAESAGVSKSSVSREFLEASEEALKQLMERRFDQVDILILYLDGLIFGEHHVIAAIGVDLQGNKHVLGLQEQRDQAKATMRAAYRLEPPDGMAPLEQLAQWYEKSWPQAAASLPEGLAETFTVNAMGLPSTLRRCLCTTNLIESPGSGVRLRTRRVCRWRDGVMVLRWAATAMLATEKHFRRIMGHEQLWMLESYLKQSEDAATVAAQRKVG